MKKLFIVISISICFVLSSCKKNWVCECKNPNSTYTAGELDATKRKAEKKCKSLSSGDTECYVK